MRKMKKLKILAPLCFCCLLVFPYAQYGAEQEQNVIAGIDPATEVRFRILWEFTVIDSSIVNAFATGGGKVVVYEGFLDMISKGNGGKPNSAKSA